MRGNILKILTPNLMVKYNTEAIKLDNCKDLSILIIQDNYTWCPDQGLISEFNLNGSLTTTDCYAGADDCISVY